MARKTTTTRPAEAVQAPEAAQAVPTASTAGEGYSCGLSDLVGLRDLLGLATMAAEADRVLGTLDSWEPHLPGLAMPLGQIDAWREWELHRHHLGPALNYMRILTDRLIAAGVVQE